MSQVLDGLKERLDAAKARLAAAQQQYQLAGVELQSATNECNIWTSAVSLETRTEEKRLSEAKEKQIPMNLPELPQQSGEEVTETQSGSFDATQPVSVVNKTQKVRETLRAHASGINPSGLWTELKDHISSRAYLYSILKRLRDNDEVFIRKGKYILKPKAIEIKREETGQLVIQ